MVALSPNTFLAGVEMIQQQLRIKREDRWSPEVCKLKFVSFQTEFPEVNDAQFFWTCEQWIQQRSVKDYATFPIWTDLMAPLYAVENGLANRSWGFKRELPQSLQPSDQQKAMLPAKTRSIAGAADPHNAAAYVPFEADGNLLLPSMMEEKRDLTKKEWANYLRQLAQEGSGTTD
jgi:hypothetical protein